MLNVQTSGAAEAARQATAKNYVALRLKPLPFREIKRRLEAAGFQEVSQKGSHVKFSRVRGDRTDTAIVPRKHEIPVGTLRSILNQTYISPEDWEQL